MLDRTLGFRWVACAAALCGMAGLARASDADVPVTATLDWQRSSDADSCIEAAELERAVEARLQRKIFVDKEHDVVLTGRVSRGRTDTWTVELSLAGAHGQAMGTRTLETQAENCSSLDDSLALVLAVMLDIPKAEVPAPEPPVAEPTTPTTPEPSRLRPAPRSTPLRVPKETPPRREPWRAEVGAGAVGIIGLLPQASFGLSLRALATPPRFWTLGFEALALRSVDGDVRDTSAGANFSPKSLGLWVCPVSFDLGAVDTRACLVEHIGRLRVEGFGFDQNQTSTRTYVNAGLRLEAFGSLVGPLGVSLTLGLDVPIVRESFRYGDATGGNPGLFRMQPVLGITQIGLAARFW